ncbi:MAG: Gfo/Idh/MocA family oxidoreductase [Planctomycetales bacterium]|nr:Gfo/Idh/MocA family oxidoreductase [Planctomycetales bacterium]
MSAPFSPNRRDVLRFAAATTAFAAARSSAEGVAPSDRITLGVVGLGPRCTYDLSAMLKLPDVQCVAICDVQASRREAGKKLVDDHYQNADCKSYRDFRELLARDDIDAVLIATGDRWHAPASMLAAEAGKDVYSEKPCGLTIDLCQRLHQTIERTGRVFQAGTQRRSVPNFQQAVDLTHSGKLGSLHTMYASVYRPHIDTSWRDAQPTPDRDVVDWNMWLGPCSWRPFNQQYVDGGWRGYYEFDSGAKLLDWGAHTVDLCQWANQSDDTLPVRYEPGENQITAHYASGVKLVLDFLDTPFGERPGWVQDLGTCPVRFEGDEGSVETGDSGGIVVKPDSLKEKLTPYKRVRGTDVEAHARNFFDCVRSRKLPNANHHVMRRSHIAAHAAALSWILQRPIEIDPATETFVNDDEANRLKARPERAWQ